MTGGLFKSQSVLTPYGEGIIESIRDEAIVVKPTKWKLAGGQTPTFYLNRKDVKPKYAVGDIVTTSYGQAKISGIRQEDGMFIVLLVDWKLATSKCPTLYIKESAFLPTDEKKNIISKEEKFDMFTSCVAKANAAKAKAGNFFKGGQIEKAKENYILCLKAIEILSSDILSNKQRAKVFDLTVTSSNNAALCFLRLKKYSECAFYAKSALNLISALEPRMETGKVWQCLLRDGMTKDKLFKEWKKKSLFYIGKSELMRKNYKTAIDRLREALQILSTDNLTNVHPSISNNITELKDLLVLAEKKKGDEIKREKSTWQKAFKKDKTQPESKVASSTTSLEHPPGAAVAATTFTSPSARFTKTDESMEGTQSKGNSSNTSKIQQGSSEEVVSPTGGGFPYMGTILMFGLLGSLGTAAYWYMRVKSKEK